MATKVGHKVGQALSGLAERFRGDADGALQGRIDDKTGELGRVRATVTREDAHRGADAWLGEARRLAANHAIRNGRALTFHAEGPGYDPNALALMAVDAVFGQQFFREYLHRAVDEAKAEGRLHYSDVPTAEKAETIARLEAELAELKLERRRREVEQREKQARAEAAEALAALEQEAAANGKGTS